MKRTWSKLVEALRLVGGIMVVSLGMLVVAACGQQAAAPTATPTEAQAQALLPTPTTQPTTQVSPTADTGPTPTPTIAGERPVPGGEWSLVGAYGPSVDPWDFRASHQTRIFFNGLLQQKYPYDPAKGIEYEPYLATEYSQSADGSKWRFKLRQGVTWHDGEVFNADDVVATVQRAVDPGFGLSATQLPIRHTFVGAQKVDDLTVVIDTGSPNALAFAYITSPYMHMAPEHLILGKDPASTDVNKRWNIMHPNKSAAPNYTGTLGVGTGPWKMEKWEPLGETKGTKNLAYFKFDQYGNRLPYMDSVRIVDVPDRTRAMAQYISGNAEATMGLGTGMNSSQAKEVCKLTRGNCYFDNIIHAFGSIYLNPTSTSQFTDPKVVQAARYSQDIGQILRAVYGDALSQGYMWIDRNHYPDAALSVKEQHEVLPWSDTAKRNEFVQKTKDLMAEAGYPEGFDTPFPFFSGHTGGAQGFCTGIYLDQISRHVDQFHRGGIRTIMECRAGIVGADELKANRWSMHFTATPMPFAFPGHGLSTWALLDSGPLAGAPWRWAGQLELDNRFRVTLKTVDPAKRNELYKDIERYLANPSLTTVPHSHSFVHYAAQGCVRNYRPGGIWFSWRFAVESVWLEPDSKCRG